MAVDCGIRHLNAGLPSHLHLYLSRYISQTKAEYYRQLQQVRDSGDWESWIIYILHGITVTARHTTALIEAIGRLLKQRKHQIRSDFKFYSQDSINNIFHHPYTKAAFLENDIGVSRATAVRYLDALSGAGILSKHQLGREKFYVNTALVELLFKPPALQI